jgi:heme/copper-type cytochrome/quinol oxidase subunit 1
MKFKHSILFLISTLLCLLFGIITREQVFDIQFHDTYFVFDNLSTLLRISLLAGIFALIHFS